VFRYTLTMLNSWFKIVETIIQQHN
jgi:hypothetical protein